MEDRKQVEKIVSTIKEYDEKTIEEKETEKKLSEALKLIFEICEKMKINPVESLKECCIKANVEFPEELKYLKMLSLKGFGKIKKGDTLIFDRVNTELEDKGIYFFYFIFDGHQFEDWGIYNKGSNTIETDRLEFNIEDVTIWGKLFQVERKL